ncbi:MAG: 3-mercaptopyruvate sulfurtransferase [Pseudomonadota bacterium]
MQVTCTPAFLFEKLEDVKVIDASWYLPSEKRDPYAKYLKAHIPTAQFFDIDAIADQTTDLPHMVPSEELFASAVGSMGISNSDHVVIYDGSGLFSAARVWWLFRIMGHKDVCVLDGGFPAWCADGFPVNSGPELAKTVTYESQFNPKRVVDAAAVLDSNAQILDARPLARFRGEAEEPRDGLRKGHIPGSTSLFFGDLLESGKLKPESVLKDVFTTRQIDLDKPIITTCGSGVTAAVITLALASLGADDTQLYDGSWAEWGAQDDLPVAIGND